jgi:uncharacterized protein with ACT and thioredoxin-like domain
VEGEGSRLWRATVFECRAGALALFLGGGVASVAASAVSRSRASKEAWGERTERSVLEMSSVRCRWKASSTVAMLRSIGIRVGAGVAAGGQGSRGAGSVRESQWRRWSDRSCRACSDVIE